MDFNIYKVIFKGVQESENKILTLSFKDITSDMPIKVPSQFILELKKLSEISQNIFYFQNIEEVLIIGTRKALYSYNYYFVVLYTVKLDGTKVGYLIGNVKKLGDIIAGIWLFNLQNMDISPDKLLKNYDNLINKPHEYSNICLIDQ